MKRVLTERFHRERPRRKRVCERAVSEIQFRPYQSEAFVNRENGTEVWLWGRQTGKSFTLAAWAVDRLLTRPGRLVTILSNSRANGAELNRRCGEICEMHQKAFEQRDLSPDVRFENMVFETRVTVAGRTGRIKVLAANPRTARGFSGDLILDEFAHHEDSHGIWEAVEPILAANRDYLCRIASTPNGQHNMFYRLVWNGSLPVRRMTRSMAYAQGLPIFHPVTRALITPEEARALALDKRAYDQNYECIFGAQNMALLTHDLITAAEDPTAGSIWERDWPEDFIEWVRTCPSRLYIGIDVGRTKDWTVITVLEQAPPIFRVRGMLRLRDMRLPLQQERIMPLTVAPNLGHICIDMTGIGLGLYEYTRHKLHTRISGVNFASKTVPNTGSYHLPGGEPTIPVTEVMATRVMQAFESGQIRIPVDELLREDLRKPERIILPSGKVSIAAVRDGTGHADHFWSLALAFHASTWHLRPVAFGGGSFI